MKPKKMKPRERRPREGKPKERKPRERMPIEGKPMEGKSRERKLRERKLRERKLKEGDSTDLMAQVDDPMLQYICCLNLPKTLLIFAIKNNNFNNFFHKVCHLVAK